jgi:outer membrane protein assembly factor BamB/tetratricopeptide (TPR) repeat protein
MDAAQALEAPVIRRAALPFVAAALAAVLAAALAASPFPAAAFAPDEIDKETWSVEASEEVRSRIEKADSLLARGVPEKAIPLLQEILDRYPDHLVADRKSGDPPMRFDGARDVVLAKIRGLRPEVRRVYEAAAAPRLAEAIDRALRLQDPAGLEAAAARWLLAGPDAPRALLAAADLRLARGEPGRAVVPLRMLMREFAGTPAAGPATVARLVRALGRCGDRDGLLALRAGFASRESERVRTGEGDASLEELFEAALAEAGPGPRPGDTPTLGGGPARRGQGIAAEPLVKPRWTEATPRADWTRKDNEQRNREPSVDQSLEYARPVAAALVDGVLYYHWSFDLQARDLYTGRERWRYRVVVAPRTDTARTHGSILTCPAVADGVVYAPLQVWPAGEPVRNYQFASQDIIPHIPVRRLFAVDAATGRLLWSHEDPRPSGDPFADRLRFLNVTSAPLVLGDTVIAAGAMPKQGAGFSAWCFASDRRTGEVRWMSPLGSGQQELNLFGRKVKEAPVAAVSAEGGKLYVQTNLGFLSCLDAASGRPIWTRGYVQVPIPPYDNFWTTPERWFTWSGSPPILSGGLVVFAPADGADLLALDAANGELKWKWPCADDSRRPDAGRTFRLLAADDERFYLAGTSVRALDMRGRLVWDTPFPGARSQEVSQGRGVLAGGRLFVPSDRALYALDVLHGGKIVHFDVFPGGEAGGREGGGGNLVTTEGSSVFVRLGEVEAYYRAEDVCVRARKLLQERPGDPEALLEAARIYLAADKPEDALPLLDRLLAAAEGVAGPAGERLKSQARECLLEVLQKRAYAHVAAARPEAAREAFLEAAALASDPADAASVLLRGGKAIYDGERSRLDITETLYEAVVRLYPSALLDEERHLFDREVGRSTAASYALYYLATWSLSAGRITESAAYSQRIVERPATDLLFQGPARDRAREFLADLIRNQGEEVYAPFERQAEAALEEARAKKDLAALAGILERWPNSRAATRAALEETRVRLEKGDAAGAVASASRFLNGGPEEEYAAAALWLLSEALIKTGRVSAARAQLQRLARRYPDIEVPVGDGRLPAAQAVARRLESAEMRAPPPAAPGLPAVGPLRQLWRRDMPPTEGVRHLVPEGEPIPAPLLLFLRRTTLTAVAASTGETVWSRDIPASAGYAVSAGGALVFARESEAVAIEPATGRDLWSVDLRGNAHGAVALDSMVVVMVEDPSEQDSMALVGIDATTGEFAWPGMMTPIGPANSIRALSEGVLIEGGGSSRPELRVAEAADGNLRPFLISVRPSHDRPPGEPVPSTAGPILVRREDSLDAYDPILGQKAWTWRTEGGSPIQSVAPGGSAVAVVDGNGRLQAVDYATGNTLWHAEAGPGRATDPSGTALLADDRSVWFVTADGTHRGGVQVEARDLRTGDGRGWVALSRPPVLVELRPAGSAVIVKYCGVRGGKSGVVVIDRERVKAIDEFADDRIGGDGFEAVVQGGVLVVTTEQVVIVRGK